VDDGPFLDDASSKERQSTLMSFDLHLEHFSAGGSGPVDTAPIAAVLSRQRYSGPIHGGYYTVEFEDGASVAFDAGGLDGRDPFSGCCFHIRGVSPSLFEFVFAVAWAGDFVIFNCQGADTEESPVLILVRPGQEAEVPSDLGYKSRPVCASAEILARLLFPDFGEWQKYRDQIVGQ
jgi:hypothetical protein